jgi:cytosine/adenosine deaminase-related metal-dependent hydrolase
LETLHLAKLQHLYGIKVGKEADFFVLAGEGSLTKL